MLRNVAASSIFALALLGAEPQLASAAGFEYELRTGTDNPFLNVENPGLEPQLADLDGDGDFDLLSGTIDPGTFRFWTNTGDTTEASFAGLPAKVWNGGLTLYAVFWISTDLADMDADGDLDIVATHSDGVTFYAENVGSAAAPSFSVDYVFQAPFEPTPLPGTPSVSFGSPALGDLDGDGDFDLVVGEPYGDLYYSENVGTAEALSFVERTGAQNPFDGLGIFDLDGGARTAPDLVDLDGDGDLDLVVGQYYYGQIFYFENVGTPASPSFVARTGSENPFDGLSVGQSAQPDFADLDGDGDLDMVTRGNVVAEPYLYYERVQTAGSALPLSWGAGAGAAAGLLATGWRRLRRMPAH